MSCFSFFARALSTNAPFWIELFLIENFPTEQLVFVDSKETTKGKKSAFLDRAISDRFFLPFVVSLLSTNTSCSVGKFFFSFLSLLQRCQRPQVVQ